MELRSTAAHSPPAPGRTVQDATRLPRMFLVPMGVHSPESPSSGGLVPEEEREEKSAL